MSNLLKSRKFMLLALDTIIATASLLVTNHFAPDLTTEVLALIAIVQPLLIAVVVGITAEDTAQIQAGTHPNK